MINSGSSPDFPFLLWERESEIVKMSDSFAVNKRVYNLFECLMHQGGGGCCLAINGQNVLLEWAKDVDVAYRLFLASPQPNQEYRHQQAKKYFKQSSTAI